MYSLQILDSQKNKNNLHWIWIAFMALQSKKKKKLLRIHVFAFIETLSCIYGNSKEKLNQLALFVTWVIPNHFLLFMHKPVIIKLVVGWTFITCSLKNCLVVLLH
jgi:hypothetical protein